MDEANLIKSTWPNRLAESTIEPARRDFLVRNLYLHNAVMGEEWVVKSIKHWYEDDRISIEELEMLLDAVILREGLDAVVKCPRCGAIVHGIGAADGGMTAVRCNTPDCHFVGYVDG